VTCDCGTYRYLPKLVTYLNKNSVRGTVLIVSVQAVSTDTSTSQVLVMRRTITDNNDLDFVQRKFFS
jgi:hypothetical protein